MILVDTSIWIEFFKAKLPFFDQLKPELEKQNVLGLECIFGELLQGAKNKKEIEILVTYWNNLPKVDEAGLWIEAGIFSSQNQFFSKGVGLIDALLIAASKKYQATIWTLDKKLKSVLKPEETYSFLI